LTLAGGAALLAGCPDTEPVCNANPDPCCASPTSEACKEAIACKSNGGVWNGGCEYPDMHVPMPDMERSEHD
jgi:hypothetical protein